MVGGGQKRCEQQDVCFEEKLGERQPQSELRYSATQTDLNRVRSNWIRSEYRVLVGNTRV